MRRQLGHDNLLLGSEPLHAERVTILDADSGHDAGFELEESLLNWVGHEALQLALCKVSRAKAIKKRKICVSEPGENRGRDVRRN
jgi:hypothetical protein